MGGKKSRNKGAAGENEVCKLLRETFPDAKRELSQYQHPLGRDISNTQPLCIQVKRHKTISNGMVLNALYEAFDATNQPTSAADGYEHPIVFYREDHYPWMVATTFQTMLEIMGVDRPSLWSPQADVMLVTMTAEQFIPWFRSTQEISD